MFQFRLKFHWNLFLRVQLTIFHHWLRQWLGTVQATSHYLNQWWLVYRRICASLGLNELNPNALLKSIHYIFCSEIPEHVPGIIVAISVDSVISNQPLHSAPGFINRISFWYPIPHSLTHICGTRGVELRSIFDSTISIELIKEIDEPTFFGQFVSPDVLIHQKFRWKSSDHSLWHCR